MCKSPPGVPRAGGGPGQKEGSEGDLCGDDVPDHPKCCCGCSRCPHPGALICPFQGPAALLAQHSASPVWSGFTFTRGSVCRHGQVPLLGTRCRWELLALGTPWQGCPWSLLPGGGAGSELLGDAAYCSPEFLRAVPGACCLL